MKIKKYISLLFIFAFSFVNAQIIEIKGNVLDSKTKLPLSGANIVIKNSKKGVMVNIDGNYTIKANANDVLTFSNVGYASQTIKVITSQIVNILLVEESNKLEEVVINVGYGTQKKKNVTNAISSIKSDAFDDRPIYNVGQAIQGNAAGVNVVQTSGKPGAGLSINIRGLNSIQSGTNPLYVIDGVQTYSTEGISTEDIVDIQILKDATATAIYGVNGSSGVVLITTKRGKANKNVFTFSSYYGASKIVKNIDVLNLDQYKSLMSEISSAYVNQANNPMYSGINTNWRDLVFRTGTDKNLDFSYSGGSDKIKTFSSLGYQDVQGIVSPSMFSRLSGRINLDVDATPWLKAHVNMNLMHTKFYNTSDNNSANQGGVILSTLTTPAFLPVYADELQGRILNPSNGLYYSPTDPTFSSTNPGGLQNGQFALNPSASLENPVSFQSRVETTNTYRYLSNLGLDITLLKNLVWKPSSTVDMSRSVYDYFIDSYRSNAGRSNTTDPTLNGIGREHITTNYVWNFENTLNYSLKSGKNDLNFLVGNSIQKYNYHLNQIEGTGFPTDLRELDLSQMMYTNPLSTFEIIREKNYVSYFGRATYNYKGKYILNGVYRASGSSQLATGHKWGYFPGISGAWIISNENLFKDNKIVSEIKLRGGWGKSGNISGLGEYAWYSLMPVGSSSTNPVNYENKDLTWETTTDINVGLDLGFFNNRVRLTTDIFKRNTINLVRSIVISNVNYTYNAGELENKGLEFAVNTINFKGNFNWNTNFNISFIKSNMLKMGYQPIELYGYESVNRLEANQPLGNFYGYVVDRVNPNTGKLEYKDLNGDGAITPSDRTVIGNALPKYTFGLTNTFTYKGFSLDALVTSSQGNDIFNATRIELEAMQGPKNQSTAVLNRWTTVGQITDVPKANDPTATYVSSRFVEDGSYVRLKAVTLAYTFKKSFLGLSSLKFYATGQNLYTWTKYSGFDPEVSANFSNSGTSPGVDYGTYPQVRTYILGLKAGF